MHQHTPNLIIPDPPLQRTLSVLSLLPLTNILESEDHAIWYTGPTCDLDVGEVTLTLNSREITLYQQS